MVSWEVLSSKGREVDEIPQRGVSSTLCHMCAVHCNAFPTAVHLLLKGEYTGHEKTYSGDVNISPRLAETKRNQQFLEKSVLPFFLGRSRFWLFHLFFLLNPGNPPPPPPLVHAAATRRGGAGGGSPGLSRKNR